MRTADFSRRSLDSSACMGYKVLHQMHQMHQMRRGAQGAL
jgi:hypothetical protein